MSTYYAMSNGGHLEFTYGTDVFVARGVTVGGDGDDGISSNFSGAGSHLGGHHHIDVLGTVAGELSGINLGGLQDDDGLLVRVRAGGDVYGLHEKGIYLTGIGSIVKNEGYIYGATSGVVLDGIGPGQGTIINAGLIESDGSGISRTLGSDTETIVLTNTGTIEGMASYDASVATAIDLITNTGSMVGAISLGAGADLYEGSHGHHTTGAIDGGAGNDTIYGGAESDSIVGGTENDTLRGNGGDDTLKADAGKDTLDGGLGNDKLYGGSDTDKDYFRFTTKLGSSNVDRIYNFNHTYDTVQLDDAIFAKLGSSVTSSEFYAHSGATKAHDSSDRIIYDTSTGKLYYDDDGNKSGGHAAVQFAALDHPTGTISYSDFDII